MTFLPIVERELRVAARKGRTYWSRVAAGAAAVFLAAGVLGLAEMQKGAFGTSVGLALFSLFKWLSFAFACLAGIFLTSDCLSEEKREGTLGLLFLTDLRGYDVVLGKLLTHSVHASYGLLAAFPVIGLSFLLGGVTGGEFWRLILVVFNTLLFSLSAGVLVSSRSRDAQKAMGGTLVLVGFFLAIPPVLDWAIASVTASAGAHYFSWFGPLFAFGLTGSTRLGDFWLSFGVVHATAWLFFLGASFLARRRWQGEPDCAGKGTPSRAERFRFGSPSRRLALRRSLLADDPIRWLAVRDQWLGRVVWFLLISTIAVWVLVAVSTRSSPVAAYSSATLAGLVGLVLFVAVASQASRFLLDGKQSGALELLLVTPVRMDQIVRGHWWALRRMFLLPVIGLLLWKLAITVLQIAAYIAMLKTAGQAGATANIQVIPQFVGGLVGVITYLTEIVAVAWFGMWMGLTTRKINVAVSKTIVFVVFLPWLALTFIQLALMFSVAVTGTGFWLTQVIVGAVAVSLDVAFIVWSRRKVLGSIQELAVHDKPSVSLSPPPLPPLPPPIPAAAGQDSSGIAS